MASITFSNLKSKTNLDVLKPTYTDLHLDITGTPNNGIKDIQVDTDIRAIKNSLSNLFTTMPGQKLLNPAYGLNLMQFLFDPISKVTANLIGQSILRGIKQFEPRIEVVKVRVLGNIDENTYNITLIIRLPDLPNADPITLNSILSQNSTFTFI